jgi:hypothetical protein
VLFNEEDLFYAPQGPRYYEQGDIVLAPIGLLHHRPVTDAGPEEAPLPGDLVSRQIWTGREPLGAVNLDAQLVPAVITTHGCAMDKEFNRRYEALRREGKTKAAAVEEAAADRTLDPLLNVAPVVPLADAAPSAPAQLLANKVNGFFPVCPSAEREIDGGVATLLEETTIERDTIVERLGIMSEDALGAFRYALARFWVYRAPALTFELERAIGKKIVDARVEPETYALALDLNDGSELHFVQGPPGDGGGPERPGIG